MIRLGLSSGITLWTLLSFRKPISLRPRASPSAMPGVLVACTRPLALWRMAWPGLLWFLSSPFVGLSLAVARPPPGTLLS